MSDNFITDNIKSILEAICLIEERFANINKADDFVSSSGGTLVLDAIAMRLQVIGELVKKIEKADQTFFDNHRDIEWRLIMRLRDIISHHYDIIDHEIIYDICKNQIPTLKATISKIIKKSDKQRVHGTR